MPDTDDTMPALPEGPVRKAHRIASSRGVPGSPTGPKLGENVRLANLRPGEKADDEDRPHTAREISKARRTLRANDRALQGRSRRVVAARSAR